jgi:hypothetical protein
VAHTGEFTKTRKAMPTSGTVLNVCMLYEYELVLKELALVSLSVFAHKKFGYSKNSYELGILKIWLA